MALGFRRSTDRRGTSGELASAARTGRIGFTDQKLYKTDAFLEAHPFGTVPAVFSPDDRTGVFESNSIMRAVARLGAERFPVYGRNVYESSRVDAFLDASLVFARDSRDLSPGIKRRRCVERTLCPDEGELLSLSVWH